MISVKNLTKIYRGRNGDVTANNDISFSVSQGEIVGLLGHNGAGKTTLINQLLGLVKSTSGEINILGKSVSANPTLGRYLCSVQPQGQLSLGELTPLKAVTIMGLMRGGKDKEIQSEAIRLFEALDISEWINKESAQLSGGVKRLTAFCMAVIHSRHIIVLDEPTNDVDPVRRRYLWSEIKKLTNQGKGVILVTHNVAEAESAVSRVIILHHGKILADGSSSQIKSKFEGKNDLRFEFQPSEQFSDAMLPSFAGNIFNIDERKAFATTKENVGAALDWIREQTAKGIIYDFSLSESTLEDVYVRLTEEKNGGVS